MQPNTSTADRAESRVLDPQQRELAETVRAFLCSRPKKGAPVGFFVHGPAGRGKTWLMSTLVEKAPMPESSKRRLHFHEFFRQLQRQMGAEVSTRTAINETVEQLLDGAQLLFFDELHVHDPGSAALLNTLLAECTRRRIPTLITSNYEPEELLPNPIYHHVIVPGIQTVREHLVVRTLDGGVDYRRLNSGADHGFASGTWVECAPGADHDDALAELGIVAPAPDEATVVLEGHRALRARCARETEICFDFAALLEARTTTRDILDLTDRFGSWVITGVPALSGFSRAAQQRWVTLIDVLVDRDCSLTVCSSVSRDSLMDISDPPADLFRAQSRLALLWESTSGARHT
ncbi:MAG: cell division protein ZapE [Micrococcaceae bacterium]